MNSELRDRMPEVLPCSRQLSFGSRGRTHKHLEFRRFCEPRGGGRRGPNRRPSLSITAPLSMLQLAFFTSSVCLVLFTTSVSCQSCNCNGSNSCDSSNGLCNNGCAPGWLGARCQVGNMAFGKNSSQSSENCATCSAGNAVDGNDTDFSQTNKTLSPWWCVTLSSEEDIVIINVTILTFKNNASRPRNWLILHTRDSSDSPPDPKNWTTFAYQENVTSSQSFASPTDELAVGRRVAIYLNGTTEVFLKLFEVYVYGFPLSVKPSTFNATWAVNQACNSITVTAESFNIASLWPLGLLLYGNTTEGNTVSEKIYIDKNGTQFTLVVPATSNRSYKLWITPEICLSDMIGEREAAALSNQRNCLQGERKFVKNVKTSSNIYEAWTNGSCLLISVRSPTNVSCTSPILFAARCGNNSASSKFSDDGIATLCGFINATSCEVNVTLSNNVTEFDVVRNISREPTGYIGSWDTNATCDYINVQLSDLSIQSALSLVSVSVNVSGRIQTTQQFVRSNESRAINFRFFVDTNRSYQVWVNRFLCLTNCVSQYDDANCSYSPEKNCILVGKSNVTQVTTRNRVYEALANNSCILVSARSPSEVYCDLPVSLSIRCANTLNVSNFTEDGVAMLCGLSQTLNCSVNVTLSSNGTEVNVLKNIPSPPIASITTWSAETSCDYITVKITNYTTMDPITLFAVYVNDSSKIYKQLILNNGSSEVSTSVPVESNGSYNVWVTGQRCLKNCVTQLGDTQCQLLQENFCLTTAISKVRSKKTKVRVYEALSNGSCAIIQVKNEPSCDTMVPIMLQCGQLNSTVKIQTSTTMFCEFSNITDSSCSVFITTSDGKIKSNSVTFSEVRNLSDTLWTTTPTCEFINMSLTQINNQWPIYATIRTGESDVLDSYLTDFTDISSHGINVSVPADPNLKLQIIFAQCIENITCNATNRQQCISRDSCFIEQSEKNAVEILTEYREYDSWTSASCVFAKLSSSSSQRCQWPTLLSISCNNTPGTIAKNDSQVASLCSLLPETSYECIISAKISDELTERRTLQVVTDSLRTTTNTTMTTGQIAGAAIGSFLFAALLACFIFVALRRYNARKKHENGVRRGTFEGRMKYAGNGTRTSNSGSDVDERAADGAENDNIQGMLLPEFFEYAQNDELIYLKFEKHVPTSSLSCEVGRDEKNKSKNRFQNIVPYDENRVILNRKNDYINASFINGYFKERKYIATQGPTLNTIGDFWLMIWQQRVSTIVMLTDFVENSKKKCESYFPAACSGESLVQVNVRSQKTFDCYVMTVLDVKMSSESRTVTHYHMLAWKDHCIPDHCAQILLFYSLIQDLTQQSRSTNLPTVVVHCSAGAGRTGTFIAFDWLQHCAKVEKRIDVDRCVKTLRAQRMHAVQTKEQYLFLHKVVLYGIKTLHFTFNVDFLNSFVHQQLSTTTSTSRLDEEWQLLNESRNTVHRLYEAANKPENRCKNRSLDILASDSKRVILQGECDSPSDYINAVYCNGCYSEKGFVVSQIPLQSTVNDFWRMVHDIQASCIVLTHHAPEEEDFLQYYPHCGESMQFGGFIICNDSTAEEKRYSHYETFNLLMLPTAISSESEVKELRVKLFVLTTWKLDEATPRSSGSIISLLTELAPNCQDSSRRPIVVQCRDGASHSGLFVCAANAFHRLNETNQVQVFHSVDLARISRPEFIISKEQYRFIYFMLLQHHESFAVYANA